MFNSVPISSRCHELYWPKCTEQWCSHISQNGTFVMASQVNCVITRGHMIAYISDVLCSYLFVLCVNYSGECGHEAHVCVWLNVLLFFPYYLSLTFFNIGVTGHSGWLQTQYQCLNIYWLRRKQHMATRWYSWTCGQNAVIDIGRWNTKSRLLPLAALASYLYDRY